MKSRSWKTNFFALLAAETFAMIGFGLSMPVIPLFLEHDIGIHDTQALKLWVGVIQSCPAVALAVFAPIWGHLADLYSRRMMLMRAMFGGAVIISLMTFVQAPWQLLTLRTIQGCLTGTVAAATVLCAGIAPPAQIAFTLGLLQTGIAIGNSVGPLFGGVLADFIGYRSSFLGTGVTLALAGFIVLLGVDDDKADMSAHKAAAGSKAKFSLIPDVKPVIGSPVIMTLMLGTFAIQAANTVANPMLPLFLQELALKANPGGAAKYIGSSTGFVLGVGAAFTAIAAALVGKFAGRLGYWRTLIVCLFAGALASLPQFFVTNMFQLTALRAVSSFFIGGAAPVLSAIIAVSTAKEHQGAVYGFNASVSSAGGALGPMIGSALSMAGYRMVFLGSAVILGASGWVTLHRRPRLSKEEREAAAAR